MSTRFNLSMEMSRLTQDGTAEPVSRDQTLRHARGQGNINFPCSADHVQDWQPYPVDPYSAICDYHTYIEGGREAKKRKKPQNSCRRRAGNGGDIGGKQKKSRKERVGSVAANPDNLGSNKEAGGGAQGAQGSSKICTSRESVSPLSRLIRGFRNKYH